MNAAAYARYSTDNQTENSIAYQMTAIDEYCAKKGINITARYYDEAKSGTNIQRADFQEMERAALNREFDAIVIYDISRGSRDVADWFNFRKDMARLGIQVISVSGQLGDLMNPNDFLVELINVGLGQHMVLDTRKKSIDGVAQKAQEGVFLGGYPPYGYRIENRKYVIVEAEARHVRLMFDMYAAGKSYADIMERLKDERIVTRHGVPIGKTTLYSILNNERYIGTYIWCEKITKVMRHWAGGKPNPRCVRIEDAIPAIIDKETWEKVRKRMRDNKHNARNKAKTEYLLSGLIECAACGSTYVGHTSTNTKGYKTRYYVCGNKYRTRSCASKNINADQIETFVMIQLREYLKSSEDLRAAAEDLANQVNGATPDLSAEKKELLDIKTKLQNGTKAILSGLDFDELRAEMDNLRLRKDELEDIISHAQQNHGKVNPDKVYAMFLEMVDKLETAPREVVEAMVKVYANTDGSYTVNIGVHLSGSPCWARTNDPAVNSRMLYRLS